MSWLHVALTPSCLIFIEQTRVKPDGGHRADVFLWKSLKKTIFFSAFIVAADVCAVFPNGTPDKAKHNIKNGPVCAPLCEPRECEGDKETEREKIVR